MVKVTRTATGPNHGNLGNQPLRGLSNHTPGTPGHAAQRNVGKVVTDGSPSGSRLVGVATPVRTPTSAK